MSRPNPMLGSYVGAQTFIARAGINNENQNTIANVLAYLNDASRAFERDTQRFFFPYLTTNLYRWPQFAPTATWSLWVDEDLLSVSSLVAAATGINTIPIPITHYFLEPQAFGPPYSRIEVDLSSSDAFQSGSTPQRSISVTGQWGYTNATQALGTVAGLSTGTPTTCTLTGTQPDIGDVLLIESEALYVAGYSGTSLTVQRGVNGTTAVTHTDGTAVSRYVAPSDVQTIIIGDAMEAYLRNQIYWQAQQALSGGEIPPTVFASPGHAERRLEVIEHYERIRVGVV